MKLIIILLALLIGVYQAVLSIVQYRSASNPTPANLSDVYDADTYEKWKKYCAERSRLDLVFNVISTVITLVLLGTNLYSRFASLFPDNVFMQLLAVIILEVAVGTVTGIVRSYIANMVIEEKYGFNRSTKKTFVIDKVRGLILELALSLAIVLALWGIYMWVGDWMVLIFAIAVFLFSMLISFLYPILSRVGNKFTPLEEGELRDNLMALLTKHGYEVKAIEVMDASRRTTKLNAYFTGFGKLKTIVLYDNLINAMTPDEICAVFAHELGHGLHKDVQKQQALNFIYMLVMSLAIWVTVKTPELHTAFGFEGVNYGFSYILVSIALGLIQPLQGLLMNAVSRHAEYRADRQAVAEGYGEAMITAFKKLARENFSHLAPSRVNVILEYSHPPLSERVAAVEKELGKSTR